VVKKCTAVQQTNIARLGPVGRPSGAGPVMFARSIRSSRNALVQRAEHDRPGESSRKAPTGSPNSRGAGAVGRTGCFE